MTTIQPDEHHDEIALNAELEKLKAEAPQWVVLDNKVKDGQTLTPSEQEAYDAGPAKWRRAIEISRILRRTNTGPSKVKAPSKAKTKKADLEAKVDKLFEDFA